MLLTSKCTFSNVDHLLQTYLHNANVILGSVSGVSGSRVRLQQWPSFVCV